MEIPPDILEELRCSLCETYLSRGPVYLQQDGAAVCGVCFTPKRKATCNKQYEATAKLLLFPCKNRDLGCQVKLPFVKEAESNNHEEVCEYRQYVCPVLGSARCDWVGTRTEILNHCEEQHADKIKDNSTTLTHDISKSSEQTFLLRAFQLMFLLHVKICVTTGKIYHAVRYLGQSDEAKNFTFNLEIKRNNEQISKTASVAPQGCLSIQVDSSLAMNTNSLLDMLGGFDNTTFTVTVERLASTVEKCAKCDVLLTSFVYRDEIGWLCEYCAPSKKNCKHKDQGCDYMDIPDKCQKHEYYFCSELINCKFCDDNIGEHVVNRIPAHYDLKHNNIICSSWQAKQTDVDGKYVLLSTSAGTALGWYELNNSSLQIRILTPVSSAELHKYDCAIQVLQTAMGRKRIYKLDFTYKRWDWLINIKKEDFSPWSFEFDITVTINKTKT